MENTDGILHLLRNLHLKKKDISLLLKSHSYILFLKSIDEFSKKENLSLSDKNSLISLITSIYNKKPKSSLIYRDNIIINEKAEKSLTLPKNKKLEQFENNLGKWASSFTESEKDDENRLKNDSDLSSDDK